MYNMKSFTTEDPNGTYIFFFSYEEAYKNAIKEWDSAQRIYAIMRWADIVINLNEDKVIKCRYDIVDIVSLGLEAYTMKNTQYCIVTEPFTRYWNKKLEVVEIHETHLLVRPESGKPFVIDKQFVEMC